MTDIPSNSLAAERLRVARTKAGFKSAAAAARYYGWGEAAYRHHENGTRSFGIDQAKEYAVTFNVLPSWLLVLDGEKENYRPPLAAFHVSSFAQATAIGARLQEFIRQIGVELGQYMLPELSIDLDQTNWTWTLGENDIPIMHFVNPATIGVSVDTINDGYLFAYRVSKRFPRFRLNEGDLLFVDSSIDDIEMNHALYLFRDDYGSFVSFAHRSKNGDRLTVPEGLGGSADKFVDDNFLVVGKVVWIGQKI